MLSFFRYITFALLLTAGVGVGLWGVQKLGLTNVKEVEILPYDDVEVNGSFLKIHRDVENHLQFLYGQSLWNLSVEKLIISLKQKKWIKEAQVARAFPNKVRVWIRPQDVAFVWSGVTREKQSSLEFHPVALDGSFLPKVEQKKIPNAPFLVGNNFQKSAKLRRRAVDVLELLPAEGVLSRRSLSDLRYEPKEGFKARLNEGGLLVLLGQKPSVKSVQQAEQVVRYIRLKNVKARVIDSRLKQKVLVKLRNGS